jgi:hypothetical protein
MRHLEENGVGLVVTQEGGYTYEITSQSRSSVEEIGKDRLKTQSWERSKMQLGSYYVVPFGPDNLLAETIRDSISRHNLAPRIFTKRKFLTWGAGPMLYRRKISPEGVTQEWVEDQEVWDWLESWGHERYLQQQIEDFNHVEGVYTKVVNNRGALIGRGRIARLEHIPFNKARLATETMESDQAKYAIVGKWAHHHTMDLVAYPLWDPANPFKHGQAVAFNSLYSFAMDFYSAPDVIGSLPWIRRSVAIPHILEALSENSLHIKWHIKSPAEYWERKRELLKEECTRKNLLYNEKMLEDFKTDLFRQLGKVLGGEVNVGKFWHSEKITQLIGNSAETLDWEIVAIDQKIKAFVDAQLAISSAANFQTIAGLGLHQSLANIAANGKSDSGSEQLYALKNYLLTETALPEWIICKALNDAIKVNFPDKKGLKIGFYRSTIEREQDVTSKNRITNADTI